jgi:hypothetical protein
MRITEGGNRGQIPLEMSLKLGWDELESLGRLEGLGVWERLEWSGGRLERPALPWKDCPSLERLPFPGKTAQFTAQPAFLLKCQVKPY